MHFSLGLLVSLLCNCLSVFPLWTITLDAGAVLSFSHVARHDRRVCYHPPRLVENNFGSNIHIVRGRLREVSAGNQRSTWFQLQVSRSSLASAKGEEEFQENYGEKHILTRTVHEIPHPNHSTANEVTAVHTKLPARMKKISMPVTKKSWEVWKTISRLEEILRETTSTRNRPDCSSSLSPLYPTPEELVAKVLSILRTLATKHDGHDSWKGILNKSTLLHEVEESILAIHFLQQELSSSKHNNANKQQQREIVLVDVCSGKGVFSLLASYVFEGGSESSNSCGFIVRKIIMLDKDPNLLWDHIDSTNHENCASGNSNDRPVIECWPRFNLHDIDDVVDRLAREVDNNKNSNAKVALEAKDSPPSSLAMVGIHLCKTLSPSCIGIANALGPEKCPHLVLAPCCLPRVVVQSRTPKADGKPRLLEVRQHETPEQRYQRDLAMERRAASMVRGRGRAASTTGSTLPAGACWKCGEFGHTKANCPSNQSAGKPKLIKPPGVSLDVSEILSQDRPFGSYCNLLATSIQRSTVTVRETGLTNNHASKKKQPKKQQQQQQANNWNRERKSVYIVASETVAARN